MSDKWEPKTLSQSPSSVQGSPVKTCQWPEKGQALKESDQASGQRSPDALMSLCPDTCAWRMSQLSLLGGSIEYAETWPRCAMMLCGSVYRLKQWEHLIRETDGGALPGPILPTPSASVYGSNQGGGAGRVGKIRHSLHSMASQNKWPTPTAGGERSGGSLQECGGSGARSMLSGVPKQDITGKLSATWVTALMGYPAGWLDLE